MTDAATAPEAAPAAPPPTAAQLRYTAVAIGLHWAIALLIIGLIAVGWIMDDFIPGGPGSPKTAIIQLHKSFGITVLLLTIVRIAWRLMNPPPPEPAMPVLQKYLASSVHILLYVLMLVMPLTGWIMASAEIGQHETRFFGTFEMYVPGIPGLPEATREPLAETFEGIHHTLPWVIIALLGLHVAGAIKHQFIDKDGLMARIAPGVFGRTAGPPDSGHGAIWAFGAALVVFTGVVLASMATATPAPGPIVTAEEQQAPASKSPAWTVDAAKSTLAFKFGYMGKDYEGKFPEWTAKIQVDTDAPANPDTPVDGYVRVAIPLGKVSTGQSYFDENVVQGDWFDVTKTPEAVFEVKGGVYKMSDTAYEATGVLTIKGLDHPVRLPFTLNVAGTTATMHAEVTLNRLDLKIGAGTASKGEGDTEWVAPDVKVIIDVVATRQ
ncbi:MAG: cytochrome b/b6 domain-containing protein [Hyphomonadaceae bacterium]